MQHLYSTPVLHPRERSNSGNKKDNLSCTNKIKIILNEPEPEKSDVMPINADYQSAREDKK